MFQQRNIITLGLQILFHFFYVQSSINDTCVFVDYWWVCGVNLWVFLMFKVWVVLLCGLTDYHGLWLLLLWCHFPVTLIWWLIFVKVNKIIVVDEFSFEDFLHLGPIFIQALEIKIPVELLFIQTACDSRRWVGAAFGVADGVLLEECDFDVFLFGEVVGDW